LGVSEGEQGLTAGERSDVATVSLPEGTLSFEFVPRGEGLARSFLRVTPRNIKVDDASSKRLSDALASSGYTGILVQDTKRKLLARTLGPQGWKVARAIEPMVHSECSLVSAHDIPLEENLCDEQGCKLDMRNTESMSAMRISTCGRSAWAAYTDDGLIARIVSEGPRRQGFFVAEQPEDVFETADSLVRFLSAAGKRWAVFSVNMERFIRQFHPVDMWRMVLESPAPHQHSAAPLSSGNKKLAIQLFSDYYDELPIQARFRIGKFRSDRRFSVFVVDGGFVIVRLDGDVGLIYDIYVTPSKQGQGLGGELMRCAITSLAGRASSVILHTSFPRARRLYEKFGFKVTYQQLGVVLDELRLQPPRTG
jgi:GNAT superfamily N-acetyltransferase